MGRLIDIDVLFDYFGNDAIDETTRSNIEYFASEEGTVEAIPKDQYEARLKADMVAMLKELDLTIDEIPIVTRHGVTGTVMTAQGMRKKIKENIQQKIDALKENSHDD